MEYPSLSLRVLCRVFQVRLIRHHMDGHRIQEGTLGARAHRRLRENDSYDELVLLSRCDRDGRVAGVEAPELEEALDYLRELAVNFG